MAKNKMADLRDHLFETLERLQDKTKPMEIERAQAISYVSQTIINSAKAEIEYMRLTGADRGSAFLEDAGYALPVPVHGTLEEKTKALEPPKKTRRRERKEHHD